MIMIVEIIIYDTNNNTNFIDNDEKINKKHTNYINF